MNVKKLSMGARYVFGTALGVLLVGGAAAAFASGTVDVTGSNSTTGPSSINSNTHSIDNDTHVTVSQTGSADNHTHVTVNSGNNHVDHNTTVAGFSTGDVTVMGSLDNSINTSNPVIVSDLGSNDVTATFSNDTTSSHSKNENKLTVSNDTNVNVTNTARIDNNVTANLSNGNNHIDHNTTVGNVSTGDTNFSLTSTNVANSTPVDLSGLNGGSSVTVSGGNNKTGENSSNKNTTTVNNDTNVTVRNSATIDNNFNVTTNSGGNSVNNNTTVGDISLGGANVSLDISNSAN